MLAAKAPIEFTRSFPEAREFLQSEILGPDYPVKHLIEQARNKGHIIRGKRGRGGGVVTSLDMAMLLMGALAGDTPQIATDAMSQLSQLRPNTYGNGTHYLKSSPLENRWWDLPFIEVVSQFINAGRHDLDYVFDNFRVYVSRAPSMLGRLTWTPHPEENDESLLYELPSKKSEIAAFNGRQRIEASYGGIVFQMVADWLEGREGCG
jgi:hypothetical protein